MRLTEGLRERSDQWIACSNRSLEATLVSFGRGELEQGDDIRPVGEVDLYVSVWKTTWMYFYRKTEVESDMCIIALYCIKISWDIYVSHCTDILAYE